MSNRKPPRPGGRGKKSARPTSSRAPARGPKGEAAPPPVARTATPATPPPRRAAPQKAPDATLKSSARAPDETGMLQMVPLDGDKEEEAAPSSATTFFEIPVAKAPIRAPEPEHEPAVSGGALPGTAPPGAGGGAPTPIAMAGMGMGGGGGAFGISGPVAGAGGMAGGPRVAMGGGHMGQPGMMGQVDDDRSSSYTLYVFILVALFLVLLMTLTGVGVLYWNYADQTAEVQPDFVPATLPEPVPTSAPSPAPAPSAGPKPKPKPSGGPKPASNPKPAPAPAPTAGLTIEITDGTHFTGAIVSCSGSGYRQRGSFTDGKLTLGDVPGESCTAKLTGGFPVTLNVKGGKKVSCKFVGSTPDCK